LSAADLALLILLSIGAFIGYRQGFLMALFSFAALLLGVLGAFKLLGYAVIFLNSHFDVNKTILPYLAFAVVFIAIVIAVRLLGRLIKVSIDKTFLGRIDQAAGAALGLLKAAFLSSVALWILHALHLNVPEQWTEGAWLLPAIESFAPSVALWLGEFVPFFKDIFT
jgi:membrane protein required for colicin V production